MPDITSDRRSERDLCTGEIPLCDKLSTWNGKGQHKTTPHSDRSSKTGQSWGKYKITERYPACSMRTHKEIFINEFIGRYPACSMLDHKEIFITESELDVCPKCGFIPTYDEIGQLCCNCRIWSDPIPPHENIKISSDVEVKERRNQNYQRDMRRFFKAGRRA